jgi:hypothetical protein
MPAAWDSDKRSPLPAPQSPQTGYEQKRHAGDVNYLDATVSHWMENKNELVERASEAILTMTESPSRC